MVSLDITYLGDLHTSVRHGPSRSDLETDAPVDHEGRGESFSPTDLVAAALGSCMLTIMGIVARRRGVDIAGARATVEKSMATEPHRRIGRLEVVLTLPESVPTAERGALERGALSCPVSRSLHPDVEIPIRFEYA